MIGVWSCFSAFAQKLARQLREEVLPGFVKQIEDAPPSFPIPFFTWIQKEHNKRLPPFTALFTPMHI